MQKTLSIVLFIIILEIPALVYFLSKKDNYTTELKRLSDIRMPKLNGLELYKLSGVKMTLILTGDMSKIPANVDCMVGDKINFPDEIEEFLGGL